MADKWHIWDNKPHCLHLRHSSLSYWCPFKIKAKMLDFLLASRSRLIIYFFFYYHRRSWSCDQTCLNPPWLKFKQQTARDFNWGVCVKRILKRFLSDRQRKKSWSKQTKQTGSLTLKRLKDAVYCYPCRRTVRSPYSSRCWPGVRWLERFFSLNISCRKVFVGFRILIRALTCFISPGTCDFCALPAVNLLKMADGGRLESKAFSVTRIAV